MPMRAFPAGGDCSLDFFFRMAYYGGVENYLPRIRLFIDGRLGKSEPVRLTREQSHYMFNVMRLQAGMELLVFNQTDGEWLARIVHPDRRGGILECDRQTRPPSMPPDLWLLFAPLKKPRTDYAVEKAAELGVRRIFPVLTERTNAGRVATYRLQAQVREAVEQSGGIFVPEVMPVSPLQRVLDRWSASRQLVFCDEAISGQVAPMSAERFRPCGAILVGPEGGFSPTERVFLSSLDYAAPVSLGTSVLRAETAVASSITLWHYLTGNL